MNVAHKFQHSKLPTAWYVGFVVLVLVIIGLIIWAIAASRGSNSVDTSTLSPAQIASHPDQFYGKALAVTGTVDKQLGTRAFGLEGVLVITKNDIPTSLHSGQNVSVSGTITKYNAGAVTTDGEVPANSPKLSGWTDQPMLIATAVEYK
jgi:hypothetical protein